MSDIIELVVDGVPPAIALENGSAVSVTESTAAQISDQSFGTLRFKSVPLAVHVFRKLPPRVAGAVRVCWSLHPPDVLRVKGAGCGYSDPVALDDFERAVRELLDGAHSWAIIVETNRGPQTRLVESAADLACEQILNYYHEGDPLGFGGLMIVSRDNQ